MTLRIALIGLGEIHHTHAAALRRVPGIQVVAAHDPRPSAKCEIDGVERIATLADLSARRDIDAALIAVPTALHAAVATELMSAGIDVLIEKPIATMLDDLHRLYAHADATGRACHAALHDSVGDEVVHLTDVLLRELRPTLGRLLRVTAEYHDPYGPRGEALARRPSMAGSWLDSGSNALSVVALFVDDLEAVDATLTLEDPAAPLAYDLAARVRFAGREARAPTGGYGLDASVEVEVLTSWREDRMSKVTILVYERGRIELDHSARLIRIADATGADHTIDRSNEIPRMVTQYVRVFEEFARFRDRRADNRAFSLAVHEPLLRLYSPGVPVTRLFP